MYQLEAYFDNSSTRLIVEVFFADDLELICIRGEKFARVCTLEIRNHAGEGNVDKRREGSRIFLFGLERSIFTIVF